MTITTCAVLAKVSDSTGGAPIAGAVITAKLSFYEIDEGQGFVAPRSFTARTDAAGLATLNLWPNELGSNSSYYAISIVSPLGLTLKAVAVVPNQPTANLHDICTIDPYPGKPETYLQLGEIRSSIQQVQDDVDSRVRTSDLLEPDASDGIGFRWLPTSQFAIRTNFLKLRDQFNVQDIAGFDMSGENSATSELTRGLAQSASEGVELQSPKCTPTTDAPVPWPAGASLRASLEAGEDSASMVIMLAHPGVGFTMTGPGGTRHVTNVATMRPQPTPTDGWEPGDFDWDFLLDSTTDVRFSNLMLYNPTKGVKHSGAAGRVDFDRLKMQPMSIGLDLDNLYDVSRISILHAWPWWSLHAAVRAWQENNTIGVYSKRNDNPMWTSFFSIFLRYAIRIGQSPQGTTNKLKIIGADCDIGATAYVVDPDVTFHSAQLIGFTAQGKDSGHLGLAQVGIDGTNNTIDLTGARLNRAGGNALRVEGGGNAVYADGMFHPELWDMSGLGYPAIECAAGNKVVLNGGGAPRFGASGGSGGRYGGTGSIFVEDWRTYTLDVAPTSPSTPSGFAYTVQAARHQSVVRRTTVDMKFTLTSKGNGTGAILARLPVAPAKDSVFFGRRNDGVVLVGVAGAGNTLMSITKFDGTDPHFDGYDYTLSGAYETN